MDREKVLNLAKLARIGVSDAEADNLSKEFGNILQYVSEVKVATSGMQSSASDFSIKNVMREDTEPHEPGIYTQKILEQAPDREGDYIKVKKIL